MQPRARSFSWMAFRPDESLLVKATVAMMSPRHESLATAIVGFHGTDITPAMAIRTMRVDLVVQTYESANYKLYN